MFQRDFGGEVLATLRIWRSHRSYILWNSLDAERLLKELELVRIEVDKNVSEMKEIMRWHDGL